MSDPANCLHCRLWDVILAASPRDPATGRKVVIAAAAMEHLAWVMGDLIVAAAWTDPGVRASLKADAVASIEETIEHVALRAHGRGERLGNADVVLTQ